MAIPNEALRKVLIEIEQKSIQSSQQISLVKAQVAAKKRESRMLQLTASEVTALPGSIGIYEGVGKMFVQRPHSTVMQRLDKQMTDVKNELIALDKKLHYLETTYKNSNENFERLMKSAAGAY